MVVRDFGCFYDPARLAEGAATPPIVRLYQVSFSFDGVWENRGDARSAANIRILADIYENWLEPDVTETRLEHDHEDHGHDHLPVDADADILLERAVRELLLEKGLIEAERLRKYLDEIGSRTPMLGARLVARAWVDDAFADLLVNNPKDAAHRLLGIALPDSPEISVLRNEVAVHHVVVCTLCSCYPKALLGLPPDWYKSFAYRSRMVIEPREILMRFGTNIPDDVEIRVVDSTADLRYLVLPIRPSGTDEWSEDQLRKIITRDSMIGVTIPSKQRPPSQSP